MKKRQNIDYVRVIWIGLCAALCVFMGVRFMNAQGESARISDRDIVEQQSPIAYPAGNYSEKPTTQGTSVTSVSVEDKLQDVSDVEAKVAAVAQLQNDLAAHTHSGHYKSDYKDPVKHEAYVTKLREYGSALREYSPVEWFVDVWFPWNEALNNFDIEWTGYVDHYDVLDDGISCVWVCRSNVTEHILCYVMSTYDVASQQFVNASRMYTMVGGKYLAYTDERSPESVKDVEDVLSEVYDILDHQGVLPPGVTKDGFLNGAGGDAE